MSLQFSLVEVFFVAIGINLVWANSPTTDMFTKLPMTSSGISNSTIKRNEQGMSIFQCFIECAKDADCLGVKQLDTFSCQLLDAIGKCQLASENETIIPYYQRADLSKLEITENVFFDNKAIDKRDPGEIWQYDCFTTFCRHSAVVGVSDSSDLWRDTDHLHCGSYGGDLEFDLANSVSVEIRTAEARKCPLNMVVTAIDCIFPQGYKPEMMKCSPIKNGWKVDYSKCKTSDTRTNKTSAIECDQFDGQPAFVVGISCLFPCPNNLDIVTCCPLFK